MGTETRSSRSAASVFDAPTPRRPSGDAGGASGLGLPRIQRLVQEHPVGDGDDEGRGPAEDDDAVRGLEGPERPKCWSPVVEVRWQRIPTAAATATRSGQLSVGLGQDPHQPLRRNLARLL